MRYLFPISVKVLNSALNRSTKLSFPFAISLFFLMNFSCLMLNGKFLSVLRHPISFQLNLVELTGLVFYIMQLTSRPPLNLVMDTNEISTYLNCTNIYTN